ncbi:MAG: hypothetical protein KGI60_00710 [Patescibacteria group bacterium]|nr:hypothetical protein [Patescibacteria group bacterium]
MNISVGKLVSQLLTNLDARQRTVIEGRYGIKDGSPKTLAEIGESMDVTRERIRQIEAGALQSLKPLMKKGEAAQLVDMVKTHLKNMGGLRREDLLLADLKLMVTDANVANFGNKVHFLLDVSGEMKFLPEDTNLFAIWYLAEEDRKKAQAFLSRLVKTMEGKRDKIVSHQNIDEVFAEVAKPHNLKDLIALNYISASKHFHVNTFGDFGLAHWPEVNPKTVRDWAYLVLKKNTQPIHFADIADMINKVRKDSKKAAHMQTVHNELIKDERFVLVGRGLYSLRESGAMPGTAREVMARILKDHGPLNPEELLKLVSNERLLKRNTVLINLRNRKHFTRMDDGRYTVNLA